MSRRRHGNGLKAHVPGMFVVNGRRGQFRAVSITGSLCDLNCDHCRGILLRSMAAAASPEQLVQRGMEAVERQDRGMLITGGCDRLGRLPWKRFLPAIETLKARTSLILSVHAGQVDQATAFALKNAGVDQALVDVIGDESTARDVYHLPRGTAGIVQTLDSLATAGLEIVPHILAGLHYGRMQGEWRAVDMLTPYPITGYVIIALMPFAGTPMGAVLPPEPHNVAELIVFARHRLPRARASLGCAKPRGRYRRELDVLAVKAGVNALALPSDEGLAEARARGLTIEWSDTCCSLSLSHAVNRCVETPAGD
jgi:hypothetical protein